MTTLVYVLTALIVLLITILVITQYESKQKEYRIDSLEGTNFNLQLELHEIRLKESDIGTDVVVRMRDGSIDEYIGIGNFYYTGDYVRLEDHNGDTVAILIESEIETVVRKDNIKELAK